MGLQLQHELRQKEAAEDEARELIAATRKVVLSQPSDFTAFDLTHAAALSLDAIGAAGGMKHKELPTPANSLTSCASAADRCLYLTCPHILPPARPPAHPP